MFHPTPHPACCRLLLLPRAKELGAVLLHPRKRAEVSGRFRKTANNRMEIFAAIAGLETLKQPCQVTLYNDSQYVVKAIVILNPERRLAAGL